MFNLPLDTSGVSPSCISLLPRFVFCISADVWPPVFQIRRGGFKGLLISYPDKDFEFLCKSQNKLLDRRRVGPDIVLAFRKSMLKYEGGPTMLELNDHSARPGHARLNETFILLLLTNGVRLEVHRLDRILPFTSAYFLQQVFRKLLLDQLALIGAVANDRDKALKAVGGELDASSTAFHQERMFSGHKISLRPGNLPRN